MKLGIVGYPDPETFLDELVRYTPKNIDDLFVVNRRLIDVLCRLVKAQEVDLHFDSKVITVYGDQEGAEKGYNPPNDGRKSDHMKICTTEPFDFTLGMRLEPGNAVSSKDFVTFYRQCMDALPQEHLVVQTVRMDRGFFSEENIESFKGNSCFFNVTTLRCGGPPG